MPTQRSYVFIALTHQDGRLCVISIDYLSWYSLYLSFCCWPFWTEGHCRCQRTQSRNLSVGTTISPSVEWAACNLIHSKHCFHRYSPASVLRLGGCITFVSRALQDILSKFVYCRYRTSNENLKLTLCTCGQSYALSTRAKSQLEILNINVISGIVYYRKIILESSRSDKTTPVIDVHMSSHIYVTPDITVYCISTHFSSFSYYGTLVEWHTIYT